MSRTMTVSEDLYSALEEEAARSSRTISDLVTEAIETWLADCDLDEAEHAEIESARAEAAEQGGVEFEKFFGELLPSSD